LILADTGTKSSSSLVILSKLCDAAGAAVKSLIIDMLATSTTFFL
jgi:hypothetical protein